MRMRQPSLVTEPPTSATPAAMPCAAKLAKRASRRWMEPADAVSRGFRSTVPACQYLVRTENDDPVSLCRLVGPCNLSRHFRFLRCNTTPKALSTTTPPRLFRRLARPVHILQPPLGLQPRLNMAPCLRQIVFSPSIRGSLLDHNRRQLHIRNPSLLSTRAIRTLCPCYRRQGLWDTRAPHHRSRWMVWRA